MLEVKNLKKIYSSKKGEDTVALKSINLRLPDTGLIFILGKSGSGKSTFLNVLGGLDSFDDGEIIINGKSSKFFKESDFDSYRNTYLGFVFQEFNILEDFTVGKNIELALQLQNTPVSKDDIDKILKQVDLEGFENRSPNELSGGQKQRVAIARALIKDPNVILADEPTGALDSETGKQVMDTLVELSQNKLVLVVSHDREFAEVYANRIVELRDGNVMSDITREVKRVKADNHIEIYDKSLIHIKKGGKLSNKDIEKINKYMGDVSDDTYLALAPIGEMQSAFPSKIQKFDKDTDIIKYTDTNQKSIKGNTIARDMISSQLPFVDALKMAYSNFKSKKFRLVLTLFLSVLALVFFGFATILSDYDKDFSYVKTFYEGDAYMMSISKTEHIGNGSSSKNVVDVNFTDTSLDYLQNMFNGRFAVTYDIHNIPKSPYDINKKVIADTEVFDASSHAVFKPVKFTGIIEDPNEIFEVAYGTYPDGENECAISDLFADAFVENGMRIGMGDGALVRVGMDNYDQVIGKEIRVGGVVYTISGIFKTNYHTYSDLFQAKSVAEIQEDTDLSVKMVHYTEDEARFMSKIIVDDGYSEDVKDSLFHYDAKMIMDVNDDTGAYLSASATIDNTYDLGQGEVMISALYYRNLKYGNKSTRTFEQLETDFVDNNQYEFYSRISDNSSVNGIAYAESFTVVGLIDDIDVLGNPVVYMNELDYDKMLDKLFLPKSLLTTANLSGETLNRYVTTLHDKNYELSARNEDSLILIGDIMNQFVQLFYIASGVLAIFVTLLLYNFISVSIVHKRKEIGILRAIGARGVDVVKIFMLEGMMLGVIMILVSIPAVAVLSSIINGYMLSVLPVLLVSFSFKQAFYMSLLTIFIIAISSFFPVRAIAKKKPVDAIKNN